jgi:hypothetical protein
MRPRFRALPKPALAIAVAFLAIGSVVQASIRRHHRRHHRTDVGHARFDIIGQVTVPLEPGMTAPIDVALSNRIRHDLWITGLRVAVTVDPAHAAAGCSAARDYVVTQLPRVFDPILLPARRPFTTRWPAQLHWPGSQRWRLRDLGVPALPTISMLNLADVDQNGCKGAKLTLRFWATSRYHPPYWRVRPTRRTP